MSSPDDTLATPDVTIKSYYPCPVCQGHEWYPYEWVDDPEVADEQYFAPCNCHTTSAVVDKEGFYMSFSGMDVCKWCSTAITCFVE